MSSDRPNATRRNRILGLIGLGLVSAVCFAATVYCARAARDAEMNEAVRSRGEHLAITWLVAFAICAGAWIWLLLKTIRGGEDEYVD
jgi:hypothetical protein